MGAGPNGLAAAITIAEQGFSVHVVEAEDTAGGAVRTEELTLPGFRHDVGATVFTFARLSPFFRELTRRTAGLELLDGDAAVAHPFDDGDAVLLRSSVEETAAELGADAALYRRLVGPLARAAGPLVEQFLGPPRVPRHPLATVAFGAPALLPASTLARAAFRNQRGRALFAGLAAHSVASLRRPATASVGLMMALTAHAGGWPVARGGSATVVAAMLARLRELGGTVDAGHRVASLAELPAARVRLLDLVPADVVRLAGTELPGTYARRLLRHRHGPGAFKLDWALDAPIPWRDPRCARALTVHLGGTLEEIEESESTIARGRHATRPFVLLVQPTLADSSRAPSERHTAWAYCHVPNGSRVDMTQRIEAQVERFAPGFRDVIAARSVLPPLALEARDANVRGGDVNGGAFGLSQVLLRPGWRYPPYTTPNPTILLCGAATPPGGGVHGMCGVWAARCAVRTLRRG